MVLETVRDSDMDHRPYQDRLPHGGGLSARLYQLGNQNLHELAALGDGSLWGKD
jgi:hypothetical protein